MRKFFEKYEDFYDYEYPFGTDFLASLFNGYKRKYSLVGDGIYDLIFIDNKIYDVRFKQVKAMVSADGKKAFRDETKDKIVDTIVNALKEKNIEYTINSGKIITFKYNNYIMKIEIVKKNTIPE